MFAWSAAFASVSGVVGLYASYYLSISAGAAIVLACTLFFGLASFAARWRRRGLPRTG
jgi:manganese/iron transport system permease protein